MQFGFTSLDFFNVLEFSLCLALDARVFITEVDSGGTVGVDLIVAFI